MNSNINKRDSYLVFGAPLIEQAEIDEVVDSLKSGWLGTGPKVSQFEKMMCEYTGAEYGMALNSCTAGLHLSMVALDIGPGDEVITTPMTFCATVNSIIHTGATPVLVDCDRDTQLIDPQKIEDAITPKTKAIVPVHLCGRPCDMDAIGDIAARHNLVVIEDAAHAIETKYKGKKVGNISLMTCFSFYVTKNVVTGEGGMVTTNDPEIANRIKIFGLHGMSRDAWKRFSDDGYKHYQVVAPGFKYNMMDLQAAIGIHQLKKVDSFLDHRNQIWGLYNQAFKNVPVRIPPEDEHNTLHARHLYTLMIDKNECGISRDKFMTEMHKMNIGTGVHYIGVHLHPYYQKTYGFKAEDFPNATWLSERTVSIPLSPSMSNKDVEDVIETIRVVLS